MLTLRSIEDSDLDTIFEFQSDQESCRMATVPPRDRDGYLTHMAKIRSNADCYIHVLLDDGKIVGYFLSWSSDDHRMLGYWIGREFWGQGYASSGLALFVEVLATRPLCAHVASTNVASQKVLEKNGFVLDSREEIKDSIFGPIDLMKYVL